LLIFSSMSSGIKVFAPASVANVACGFDILGFALEFPGDEIIARLTDGKGVRISRITGDNGRLPKEIDKNTAGVAAQNLLQFLGENDRGIELEINKKMPFGSGLGSSAASAAGAVVAVNELLGRPLEKRALLRFAVEGEQVADGAYHADNVAPSLLGGFTLTLARKSIECHKIPVPTGLIVAIIYPHIEILTKDARSIIAKTVTLEDHIVQSGYLAGFILGMLQSDFDLIRNSMKDLIIEPQRAPMIPHFYKIQELAMDNDGLGCSISGAGPSIFSFFSNTNAAENALQQMKEVFVLDQIPVSTYISKVNPLGTVVL
jgi:homoserine kinase